jgi:hypothetical protein
VFIAVFSVSCITAVLRVVMFTDNIANVAFMCANIALLLLQGNGVSGLIQSHAAEDMLAN